MVSETYKAECFELILKIAQHFIDDDDLQHFAQVSGEEVADHGADQIEFSTSLDSHFKRTFRDAAGRKE